MRRREIAQLNVRLCRDRLSLHILHLVHVLLKFCHVILLLLLLTLLATTLAFTHIVDALSGVHTRTRLAGGGRTTHHLAFPRVAAAAPTLCFDQVCVLGEVEAVGEEMEAEVERILLHHLATTEARVVLELHPRIP